MHVLNVVNYQSNDSVDSSLNNACPNTTFCS
jgi:hypothetical protein